MILKISRRERRHIRLAPFDYLIVGSVDSAEAIHDAAIRFGRRMDLAMLSLIAGCFLWWWSSRMGFRYRWVMLILSRSDPILVHWDLSLADPINQSLLDPA